MIWSWLRQCRPAGRPVGRAIGLASTAALGWWPLGSEAGSILRWGLADSPRKWLCRWALVGALGGGLGCGAVQAEPDDGARTEPAGRLGPSAEERGARSDPGDRKGSGARSEPLTAAPLVIARPALDRLIAAGPGALLGQVVLEPQRGADRKFQGFRIVSLFGDTPEVLRYGVRPGDILVSSQGQRVVTPGDLLTVFQKLRGARTVEVQVRRAGETLVLQWPVVEAGWRRARAQPAELPASATAATDR